MDERIDAAYRLTHRLRDIQLPDGVEWWPPALGWWLLALMAALVPFLLARLVRRRSRLHMEALRQLTIVWDVYRKDGDIGRMAASLSLLLKRLALVRDGRAAVAPLWGEAWLSYLGPDFVDGPGRMLAELPYRGARTGDEKEARALMQAARRWIARNA